jgi:hypothetical protein
VIAILEPDQFFGEGCLLDNPMPEAAEAPITNPLNLLEGVRNRSSPEAPIDPSRGHLPRTTHSSSVIIVGPLQSAVTQND